MKIDLVRAWKDSSYKAKLSAEQLQVAAHPAGITDLDPALLSAVAGASNACISGAPMMPTICLACQR